MEDEINFLKNIVNWDTVNINDFTLEQIKKYDNFINFDLVSERNDLTSEFITEYKDKLNFEKLSSTFMFSEDELNSYFDLLDHSDICIYQNLSNEFIDKYHEDLDWDMLCKYQNLSDEIINKYQYLINWDILVKNKYFDDDELHKYSENLNFDLVCKYQQLSTEFMIGNMSKLNFNIIGDYQILDSEMLEQYHSTRWSIFRYKVEDLIGKNYLWIYNDINDKIDDLNKYYVVENSNNMDISNESNLKVINDREEEDDDDSEIELEDGISALKDKSLPEENQENTKQIEENEEENEEEDTGNDNFIYCYKAIDANGTITYFDNYELSKKITVGECYSTVCNYDQNKVNFIADTNFETDIDKVVELDDDSLYITELGYCGWTRNQLQQDMKYYYPNTHYKLIKMKVYLNDLVLLDNSDETNNDRAGEIRCGYFEVADIYDAIELLSPATCSTPEQ